MKGSFKKRLVMRSLKALHLIFIIGFFYLFWKSNNRRMHTLIAVGIFGASDYLLCRLYKAYSVGMYSVPHLLYSQCLSQFISFWIAYFVICIRRLKFMNPLPFIGLLIFYGFVNFAWMYLADKLYFKMIKPKKTVVIYRNKKDLNKLAEINNYPRRFSIQKYIENPTDIHKLMDEIKGYPVIFVVGIDASLRNGLAKYCVENNVHAYIHPHVGDLIMAGARSMEMFSIPIMRVQRVQLTPEYLFAKRAMDIIVSLVALIVASPFMLITAIAIKACDGGPVFYTQTRITRDRKEFRMWKFRSMKVDAEKNGEIQLSSGANDDRITPVGRVIRACRVDELPQLFNILKGDMTIVGPRPERPESALQYEKETPAFALRLQVKAGLTGLAQVYGRYNTEPYDKLQMDLMYINRMSLFEDIRLMFATVKILFMRESTQGYSEDQVHAFEEAKKENEAEK